MLEKCKNEPQRTNGDVLANAASWHIPIYPLPKVSFYFFKEMILGKQSYSINSYHIHFTELL